MALDWCQNFVQNSVSTQIDRILPNFIYEYILTRPYLGMLGIIFSIFVTELWPLIVVRLSFPLNILRSNGQNTPTFIHEYAFILTGSSIG